MSLFDMIKDPASAVDQAVSVLIHDECEEVEGAPEPPETNSELDRLRAAARAVDVRVARGHSYEMDAQAEVFLSLCLSHAKMSSVRPYVHDPDVEDNVEASHRIVGVVVLEGDWPTVLNGRESALATVAELARQGFESPQHDYRKTEDGWRLRIRFGF